MITLRKLAYQYLDWASGGGLTVDTREDERDVIIRIRQLMAEVLAGKYFEKYAETDRSAVSLYISSYKLTPQFDKDLQRCFVTLPEFYISLPYNRGVHRAFFVDKPEKDFVLQHNPGVGSNLQSGKMHGVVYIYLEGLTMVIRNVSVEPDKKLPDVIVQLIIPAPDKIGLDDPLPILPEQQAQILRMLKEWKQPIPQDILNNGNKDA